MGKKDKPQPMTASQRKAREIPFKEKRARQFARLQRLPSVIRDYLQGRSYLQIAEKHGEPVNVIRKDMQYARSKWRKQLEEHAEEYLSEELHRINLIETEAWEGWTLSLTDAVKKSKEKDGDGKISKKIARQGQSGDPRFLQIALACVDKRCRLLKIGEYSTAESIVTQTRSVEVVVETVEQVNRILQYDDFDAMVAPKEN